MSFNFTLSNYSVKNFLKAIIFPMAPIKVPAIRNYQSIVFVTNVGCTRLDSAVNFIILISHLLKNTDILKP